MNNLVSFALRRPISLLMAIVATALMGFLALGRMARDIFPDLGVPVLYVAQPYGGLDPAQVEGCIVNYYEYHFLFINGIEHVESKSIQGVALIKLQFHPRTNMAQATAETVSYVDRARSFMQHPNRRPVPYGAGQLRCRRCQGPGQHSDPLAGNADDLHSRRRIGRRPRRHSDRLCAREWAPHRLHPRNQTSGRLDARGRPSSQSQLAALPIR